MVKGAKMTYLILQVLGNSDIKDDKDNYGGAILGDVQDLKQIKFQIERVVYPKFLQKKHISFPLIEKVYNQQKKENNLSGEVIFGIILTDQVRWMQSKESQGIHDRDGWRNFVKADGIWWRDFLLEWSSPENKNIKCYPLTFEIPVDAKDGVADWERMAKQIQKWVQDYIKFENGLIKFCPTATETEEVQIEKLIIQHSSGTPALSSGLYLWGIERKIAGIKNIEFAYISKQEQDFLSVHQGTHWKWRLKDSQIRELLKIQDFSGALQLLDRDHLFYKNLKDSLEFLDKAVSLNLSDRYNEFDESRRINSGKDAIIERVSIALWSEKAFRDRSQWLHWNFRVAGALELAIMLLVEKQSDYIYKWEKVETWETCELMFNHSFRKIKISRISISELVQKLLTTGELDIEDIETQSKKKDEKILITLKTKLKVKKILDSDWEIFVNQFYTNNWEIGEGKTFGFIALRNKLYHSLMGDLIDRLLDAKTEELNRVDHDKHPSQVAVKWLNYIVDQAGVLEQVNKRVQYYNQEIQKINGWLEWNKNG